MINWCKNCETTSIETNYKLNQINEWIIDRKQLYMNVKIQKKKHAKHECTWYDSK
jgi:hypothetical protein